jgi:hypothetical protein
MYHLKAKLDVIYAKSLHQPENASDAASATPQAHVRLEPFSVSMIKSPALLNRTFATDAVTAWQGVQRTLLF